MYYNIRTAWEPSIIGVKNGIYQVELDKMAYDSQAYAALESLFIKNVFSANQFNPEIDFKLFFKKLKSAKKTSIMSFSPNLNHCHFLMKDTIVELFGDFNIQQYKAIETVVYDTPTENVDESYRMLFLVLQDWDVIDFENTVFTTGGFGKNPKIELSFKNEADLNVYNGITNVKTLSLKSNFDKTLDLFLTRLGGMFVSDNLRKALESANVTGLKYYNDIEVLFS
jgi:hypothetical protein